MSFCVIIAGIGVGLIGFAEPSNYLGAFSGFCFLLISVAFMSYSLYLYRYRAAALRNNMPSLYDDYYGPTALFLIMTSAGVLNGILSTSHQLLKISEARING